MTAFHVLFEMKMRTKRYVAAIGLLGLCVSVPPVAARDADPPRPPQFSILFPNPTGQNGFEDIVAAADSIRSDAALDTALAPGATLSQKRAALNDPVCRQALAQMRSGLVKAISAPRQDNDRISAGLFHVLPLLERLGNLLAVEQYVFCADGRTEAAVNSLEDAFRLTDAVRSETLMGAFYADIIDQHCVDEIACHMGQWSLANCNRIILLIQSRITIQPDPGIAVVENGRRAWLAEADTLAALLDQMKTAPYPSSNPGDAESFGPLSNSWNALGDDPILKTAAIDEVRRRINEACDRAESSNPYAAPSAAQPTAAGPSDARVRAFADAWARRVMSDPGRIRPNLAHAQVFLRLLAAHAAIRRYRWENGHLPAHLTDIPTSDLITDPYAGAPYQYAVLSDGSGYTLASIGPQWDDPRLHGAIRLPQEAQVWE